MTTNTNAYVCSVCQKLYTDPVVHVPCGLSFDRQCITNKCPAEQCGQIIKENDLVVNIALLQVVNENRFRLEPCTYYLILLDGSTSMWYSDKYLPFAIGKSRSTLALQFLRGFFNEKLNSTTDKISLLTFDSATLERFPFETITARHIAMLDSLAFEGTETALFDAIRDCLERIEQLKATLVDARSTVCLLILTDGGNNVRKEKYEQVRILAWRSKQLHISCHMIQIGDKNRRKTRQICDLLNYRFSYFNNGNVREFVDSLSNTLRAETRACITGLRRRSQSRTSEMESTMTSTIAIIEQLPDPPKTPIGKASRRKEFA